jgi:ribosomal protein L37AE/L43A
MGKKKCPRCHEGEVEKTKDGYLVCDNCDYEEYDG